MADQTYEADKVYLRNTNNGQIYPYEKLLERHAEFVPFVPNPSKVAATPQQQKVATNKNE